MAALRNSLTTRGTRCWSAAEASIRSVRIRSPACAPRDSSTSRIAPLLDSLQPVLFDLVDQIAISRQHPGPFYFEGLVLGECPLGAARVLVERRQARIHSK